MRPKRTIAHAAKPARPLAEGLVLTPPVSAVDETGWDRVRRKLIKAGRAGCTASELQRATSLRAKDLKWVLGRLRDRDEVETIRYASGPEAYRATADTLDRPIKRPGRPPKQQPVPVKPPAPVTPATRDPGVYTPGGPCEFDLTAELKYARYVTPLARNQHLERQCGTEGCTNHDHHRLCTVINREERLW